MKNRFKENSDNNILVKSVIVALCVLLSIMCMCNSVTILFGQPVLAKSTFDWLYTRIVNNNSTINESNANVRLDSVNIFWSGLGGAIFGAVFTSILQNYLLKRGNKNKEHFSDLKKEIVDPIIQSISKTSDLVFFTEDLSDLFTFYQIQMGVKMEIKNILIKDFFDNHYPHIYDLLLNSLLRFNNLNLKRGELVEKLDLEIYNQLSTLSDSVDEIFNPPCVKNIRDTIFDGKYNNAFIRTTTAEESAYIYFSLMDNYLIPFGNEREELTIMQIRGNNLQVSKNKSEEIKTEILQRLESIVNENNTGLDSYKAEEKLFQIDKNRLLTELRRIKYSTSMHNLKGRLVRKKCIFLK